MPFDVLDALTRGAALHQGRVNTQLAQRAQNVSEGELAFRRENLTESIRQFAQQQQLERDKIAAQNQRTGATLATQERGQNIDLLEQAGRGNINFYPEGPVDLGIGSATPRTPEQQAQQRMISFLADPNSQNLSEEQKAQVAANVYTGTYLQPQAALTPRDITYKALVASNEGDEVKAYDLLQKMEAGPTGTKGLTANKANELQQAQVMGALYTRMRNAFQNGSVNPEVLRSLLEQMDQGEPQALGILNQVAQDVGHAPETVRSAMQRTLGGANLGVRAFSLGDEIGKRYLESLDRMQANPSATPTPEGPPPAQGGMPQSGPGGLDFLRPRQ